MSVKVKTVEKILPDGVPWRPVETRQPVVRVRGSARVAKSGHQTRTRATCGPKTAGLPEPVIFPRHEQSWIVESGSEWPHKQHNP